MTAVAADGRPAERVGAEELPQGLRAVQHSGRVTALDEDARGAADEPVRLRPEFRREREPHTLVRLRGLPRLPPGQSGGGPQHTSQPPPDALRTGAGVQPGSLRQAGLPGAGDDAPGRRNQ